jgi:hypothetical protein
MPTELPVRSGVQARNAKWAEYGQALFIFYGSAGLAVLLLIALETRLGTFDGLTATETVIKNDPSSISLRWDRPELGFPAAVLAAEILGRITLCQSLSRGRG